jgi:3-dehydroquinate dehydratase-2
MRIMVINGPNLNMLGKREPTLYGTRTLTQIEESLEQLGKKLEVEVVCFQSNIEGELVSALQRAGDETEGVILNAGAYTHTSVAIRDSVLSCSVPVVEVHLTNPQGREVYRQVSLLADVCAGSVAGFGEESYTLALLWFARGDKRGNQ